MAFLNNIGGGLGLFMGIAFPTLIEFLQFILEIFLMLFVQKINQNIFLYFNFFANYFFVSLFDFEVGIINIIKKFTFSKLIKIYIVWFSNKV